MNLSELEALYDVMARRYRQGSDHITLIYRAGSASGFVILSTVGPEGTDASLRASREVVHLEPKNDFDPLRGEMLIPENIVRMDESLMFMVPVEHGCTRWHCQADRPSEHHRQLGIGKLPQISVRRSIFMRRKAL